MEESLQDDLQALFCSLYVSFELFPALTRLATAASPDYDTVEGDACGHDGENAHHHVVRGAACTLAGVR